MNGFVGGDVGQLRNLAGRLEMQASKLEEIASSSSAALSVAAWTGANIDRIRSEWNRASKPQLIAAARDLGNLALQLRRQADEQERASAAQAGGTGTNSGRVDPAKNSNGSSSAPVSIEDHWEALTSQDDHDGIRIQEIRGGDGVVRYVVYINGTLSAKNGNLSILDNAPAQMVGLSGTQSRMLDEMRKRIPPGSEVMIQGYSQGGIIAQNIAASRQFNVTDVVTYGSPFAQSLDFPGAPNIIRIRDKRDPITSADILNSKEYSSYIADALNKASIGWQGLVDPDGAVARELASRAKGSDSTIRIDARHVESGEWGTHTDRETYRWAGEQVDKYGRTRADVRTALESQQRYSGEVLSDSDSDYGVRVDYDAVDPSGRPVGPTPKDIA